MDKNILEPHAHHDLAQINYISVNYYIKINITLIILYYYDPAFFLLPSVPSPLSVSISSDTDNPIPSGSSPTLSCTVSLSSAVDIEVEIVTEWSGPTYGLREYTTTEPVLNSSAEVPTYTSTAQLNAPETLYDSGDYVILLFSGDQSTK